MAKPVAILKAGVLSDDNTSSPDTFKSDHCVHDQVLTEAAPKPARRSTVSPAPETEAPATCRRGRRSSLSPAPVQHPPCPMQPTQDMNAMEVVAALTCHL
jgi:hypothetical protein